MSRDIRILVAPLDWGMGHATRCIPVIRELIRQGAEVIVGGTESTRQRIREAVPGLEELPLNGYNIRYSKILPAWLKIGLQYPAIRAAIREENKLLNEAVSSRKIDGVISDNRYGLYHPDIPSVLMTHQLHLQWPGLLKWLGPTGDQQLQILFRPFDELWIPDSPGNESLSGTLSSPLPSIKPVSYTGRLSRFKTINDAEGTDKNSIYDLLVIVSGPEPQASLFLKGAETFAGKNKLRAAFIAPANWGNTDHYFNHPTDEQFLQLVSQSRHLLCRPGYSTLMDLLTLNRTALLVPTPGQTEQEYLAGHISSKFPFRSIEQSQLKKADRQTLPEKPVLSEELFSPEKNLLTGVIEAFLSATSQNKSRGCFTL